MCDWSTYWPDAEGEWEATSSRCCLTGSRHSRTPTALCWWSIEHKGSFLTILQDCRQWFSGFYTVLTGRLFWRARGKPNLLSLTSPSCSSSLTTAPGWCRNGRNTKRYALSFDRKELTRSLYTQRFWEWITRERGYRLTRQRRQTKTWNHLCCEVWKMTLGKVYTLLRRRWNCISSFDQPVRTI